MARDLNIWCDESIKRGKYYSNFYGGILVESTHLEEVITKLTTSKIENTIIDEIKWQKVCKYQLEPYKKVIDTLFELIKENKVKIRIMFTKNSNVSKKLENYHIDNEYFMLYYQFFKHHFGLIYANSHQEDLYIKAFFDDLPETYSKRNQFKEYIKGLESVKQFRDARLKIRKEDIAEVDSKKHLPLQVMDLILGSMAFRLNDFHKIKPEGSRVRGNRTIAKEKLYKHILMRIREIKPHFNIGISTGTNGEIENRWKQPYRHWLFVSINSEVDEELHK